MKSLRITKNLRNIKDLLVATRLKSLLGLKSPRGERRINNVLNPLINLKILKNGQIMTNKSLIINFEETLTKKVKVTRSLKEAMLSWLMTNYASFNLLLNKKVMNLYKIS